MTNDDHNRDVLHALVLWCLVGLVLWYVILERCGVFDA